MATYRALNDIYLGGNNPYISAGQTFLAPAGYIPSGDVDPITTDAIQAFWNAGPQFGTRQPFQRLAAPPVIYWVSVGNLTWVLTGAGASLGPRQQIPLGIVVPIIPPSPPSPGTIDSQPLGMP